jgi:hypothetical protein
MVGADTARVMAEAMVSDMVEAMVAGVNGDQ